jgi:hypothetical protein
MDKIYWGMPINIQWHRVISFMGMGLADDAYYATIELVRQSKRIGNTY